MRYVYLFLRGSGWLYNHDKEITISERNKALDDFVRFASDIPTVEEEDGEIRPMRLEEMSEKYQCSECDSKVNDLFESKNQTNADRIRNMSDEELADYIFGVSVHEKPCVLCSDDCDFCELTDEECKNRTLKWLQSEVE